MTASASSIRVVPASGRAVAGVGKYRYIAMLAEGGMADVYLAVTQGAGFEKLVVIKQLRDVLAEDPTFVTMFMDEARLAARLNHPNVVQTLEVGTDPATGLHFIAMEFLEGVAHVRLARLKERVPPPLAFHLRILVEVLRGLHYAHELRDFDGKPLNVVHRDVSPQNIMLTFAGGVKILDFGIAKAALAAEQRPEDFKGKIEYMAPEQAESVPDIDRRADVFSVGVMLWEALARRRLYQKGERKLSMLVEGQLPDLLSVVPAAPKKLAEICAKAMAHDRDQRFATADEMADELEEWLESTTRHVSPRDVGAYIAEKFASTRARISAAIEEQLTLFRSVPETAPETMPISRLPIPDAEISEPPPPELAPGYYPIPPPSTTSGAIGWTTSDGAPIVTISPQHQGHRPPSKRGTILVAMFALAGVVVLSGLLAIASKKKLVARSVTSAHASAPVAVGLASALPPTAPISPASPSPAPPSEDPQIDFTIKATPAEARIFVDGKALEANPASGKHDRDGAVHIVRIEAPGYAPREESIAFDRSVLVSIDLHPASAAASAEPPAPAAAASGGRAGHPSKTRTPRTTNGKLDPENPYQ